MHPAPLFHVRDHAELTAILTACPFCVIFTTTPEGQPLCVHAPVLFDGERGVARFHLSARNQVALRLQEGGRALIVATGVNTYISPDWYGQDDQVPTWNYQSVEIEGPAIALDRAATAQQVDDLSAVHEAKLLPKPPWTSGKMTPAVLARMLSGIIAFEVTPERFEGISKMSQNKSEAVQARVIAALSVSQNPSDQAVLAAMIG